MLAKDAHLYGLPRSKKSASTKNINTPSNVAFNTAFTSLLTASSNEMNGSSGKRVRRPLLKDKDLTFDKHNKNIKKRVAADMLDQDENRTSQLKLKRGDGQMDEASWRVAKRKMEAKARLYAAMKRGDVEDESERHMVDFDRKWAEKQDGGRRESETSSDEDGDEDDEEVVEYVDALGRNRKGTKAQAAKEERLKRQAAKQASEADKYTARPSQPENVIYGDTIQTSAFDLDEPIANKMEQLAQKRDREDTPPDDVHYDANAEVRNKGTGFFQFDKDGERRKEQMEGLEKERQETERARAQKAQSTRKEERRKEIEERRKLIREKRSKNQANQFLEQLESEMLGPQS